MNRTKHKLQSRLSERQIRMILAGSILNLYREGRAT
jgi:hypothetical protein